MKDFEFNDYGLFTDGEIEVFVRQKSPYNEKYGYAPYYNFAVRLPGKEKMIGGVTLRIGSTENLVMYLGHIGYGIDEKFRGRRYAAKACELIRPVALDHGLETLWITCNPDNIPSRRTCEILGCELVEIIDVPETNEMYRQGDKQKCRYRWDIG